MGLIPERKGQKKRPSGGREDSTGTGVPAKAGLKAGTSAVIYGDYPGVWSSNKETIGMGVWVLR